MNIAKLILLTIVIVMDLLLILSCKEENKEPTIRFVQPENNLIITNDTIVSFIVEAFDSDGTIDRVEFTKNGTIVQTVVNSEYKYDWSISKKDSIGIYKIKATAYDNHEAKGEAEIQIEIKSYLTKWLGIYKGTSHHWYSYPAEINGQWQLTTNHDYKKVLVNVNKSSQESCLDFVITFNDSLVGTKSGLNFSTTGIHVSQWGAGSSYGSLNISFDGNLLNYKHFQKCGIPCDSGTDFVINKE